MKKIILSVICLILMASSFADDTSDSSQKISFPLTKWLSHNPTDFVTIQNGAGLILIILISVDKDSSGAAVANCGTVTKIEPGSSAVCATNDPSNPVTISSDSPTVSAEGNYQIKQQ